VSVAGAVVLVVLLASVGALIVMTWALVRQMKRLAGSLKAFQDSVQPLLEEIQEGGASAQEGMERVSGAGVDVLSRDRPGRKPGARIRR
jgi:predicted PurR-regulated permease PerM